MVSVKGALHVLDVHLSIPLRFDAAIRVFDGEKRRSYKEFRPRRWKPSDQARLSGIGMTQINTAVQRNSYVEKV